MYVVYRKFTRLYITVRPSFLLAHHFLNHRKSVSLCWNSNPHRWSASGERCVFIAWVSHMTNKNCQQVIIISVHKAYMTVWKFFIRRKMMSCWNGLNQLELPFIHWRNSWSMIILAFIKSEISHQLWDGVRWHSVHAFMSIHQDEV